MYFEWDEKKRLENIKKRGVDFRHAAMIFYEDEIVESKDQRTQYGEERFQALGKVEDTFYLVVYTWRDDARHIITAWKVGEDGKKRYQALFARRNQSDE